MKPIVALSLFAMTATSACLYHVSASTQHDLYGVAASIPVSSPALAQLRPIALPRAVALRVPFTSQAPL
ncbi:MAG TPA: hypothetical protein VIO80_05540, partial [Candidatus Dormibacteraeota bacterium]